RRTLRPVADHERVPRTIDARERGRERSELLLRDEPADEQDHDRAGGDTERAASRHAVLGSGRPEPHEVDRVRDVLALERGIDIRCEPRAYALVDERDARGAPQEPPADGPVRTVEQGLYGSPERDHPA